LGVRLVDVVPREFALRLVGGKVFIRQRQELFDDWNLLHGVNKTRVAEINLIDLMLLKGFNLNLNRSNESIKARTVAELHRLADHRDTDTLEKAEPLVTKSRGFYLHTLSRPITETLQKHALNVGVEGAGKTLVGGHQNDAHLLGAFRARQERMAIVGNVRTSEMRANHSNLVSVRTGRMHPILRLAHLRGRNHLHRLGDLARVLHALDLSANFLSTGHGIGSSWI